MMMMMMMFPSTNPFGLTKSLSFYTVLFAAQVQRSFVLRSFQTWLRSRLKSNPFGVTCCLTNGRQLSWISSIGTSDSDQHRGRVVTNVHLVPKNSVRG